MALHLLTASLFSFSGTSTHAVPWQNQLLLKATHSTEAGGWKRSSFSFVFGLIYAQLTSNYWSGWTASSTLDAEKIALRDLLHHPHNKPHSKPFTLCMVFLLLYWTLIILLEIISPVLINDFSKSAGTILFGTESLKFYIFYVLSYTSILKCDWINLKNISLFPSASELYSAKGKWSPEWKPLKLFVMYTDSAILIIRFQSNHYMGVLGDLWSMWKF